LRDRKISSFLSFLVLSTGMALGGALALKTEVGISGVAAGYTVGASLAGAFLGLRIKNR
jgi:hypothetical protein